ncbi:hypothetical protein [Actinocorallia libanotica]|uniref:Uncharacterized protein n=1 Tax=Actinocorallia libanotica TaxID=46162 RepID=A0ABN1S085_9ACTN
MFAERFGTAADGTERSAGAAAMRAVDAVRRDGRWVLSGIDRLDR